MAPPVPVPACRPAANIPGHAGRCTGVRHARVATPFIAYLFRTPINNGGVLGLLTLFALSAVLLLLSVGSLMLFLRGHARALTPSRHDDLDARVPSDQRALMLAFAFDAEDLRANRAGELSARQRANLRAGRHGMIAMGATMLGVTYLGLATLPVLLGAGDLRTSVLSSDAAGMWIGVGLIIAIIGVSFLYTCRHVRDQVHDRMSIAEGVAGPPGARRRWPPGLPQRAHGAGWRRRGAGHRGGTGGGRSRGSTVSCVLRAGAHRDRALHRFALTTAPAVRRQRRRATVWKTASYMAAVTVPVLVF